MSQPLEHPVKRSPDWDQGFASGRTSLAWQRTAIASAAVAALVVRAGIIERLLGLAIPIAALILLAAVAEWLFSRRISAEHERPFQDGAVLHGSVFVLLGAVTLLVAGASVALALAS
jgi:uncharacterized membrane protein YidH (DUF202 family)